MKKCVAALLALLIVLSVVLVAQAPKASAESLYIRKIVSVVYDDSGSMNNSEKRYVYASYAMQTFCGMLNSEDQLYVTTISDCVTRQIDLSSSGIQKSVDSIRAYTANGSWTRFSAVETAFNKLKSVQDDNPNTQYWLVVITDGDFNKDTDNSTTEAGKRNFLNQKFQQYTKTTMPNGSYPQVNFMAIGGSVVKPDQNEQQGIYTYHATTAKEITATLASLADRISGRTRCAINQLDDKTIQVSSSIPLLNIAVLAQRSGAKIVKASNSDGSQIPIARSASLSYPNYAELVGGAYLLGDSQKVIKDGTYTITFDQKISKDDIVVLYEPALEVRAAILVNGKQVTNYKELEKVTEGDKISVTYDIYEMGTDKKVDPSLLPGNTKYEMTITEDGKTVAKADGNREIKDYVLKNVDTELKVAVTIEGFNPISYSARFTPRKFVLYTVKAENGNGQTSVKYEQIGSNHGMKVCFRVYGDGNPVTDPEIIKELAPQVAVSPQGNSGTVEYAADGLIVFTPNAAQIPANCKDQFDVGVTCTLANGATAAATYTVVLPKYTMEAVYGGPQSVKLDEISQNKDLTVQFVVYKDGEKLTDAEAVKALKPTVTVSPQGNSGTVTYSPDGNIIFTPNVAVKPDNCKDRFDVQVTCSIDQGATATLSYEVVLPVYTMEAEFVGADQSVKYDELASNKDVAIRFTVYKDGEAMTDPEAVKKLAPAISVAPQGNGGTTEYTADGKILFTPNVAAKPEDCDGQFDVTVTCTISEGVSAQATYTVVLPVYTMEAEFVGAEQSVKYDEIFQNKDVAIRFTVYKDGEAMTDPEAVKKLVPAIAVTPQGNGGTTEYTADGKIIFTPNAAVKPEDCDGQFDVTVTCTISEGASAQATYTVVLPVYTMEADFGSEAQSVKFDEITSNTKLTLVFTVFKDGVAMTDPNAVKALNPVFTVSPNGNNGIVSVTDEGKIIFTPNTATMPVSHDGRFAVDVTCTIDGGISATKRYNVLIAEYKVIAVGSEESIVKTRFFGNQISASFYITKDGVQLDRDAIGDQFSIWLNEAHEDLKLDVTVSNDGMVTVRPYSDQEWVLDFWNWWCNPWHYLFALSGKDVVITFSHPIGYAEGVLDVCGETVGYCLVNVVIPLLIEVIAIGLLTLWILMVVFKPRYAKGAKLCVGEIQYQERTSTHIIKDFSAVSLTKFNRIGIPDKYGRLEFRPSAKKVSANGIKIRAVHGAAGDIACEMPQPWYNGRINPADPFIPNLGTVEGVLNYFETHMTLEIEEFSMRMKVEGEGSQVLSPVAPASARYYMVIPESIVNIGGVEIIESGLIFVYINTEN